MFRPRMALAWKQFPKDATRWEPIRSQAEALISGLAGVAQARVTLTAERAATASPKPTPSQRPKPSELSPPPRFPNLRGVQGKPHPHASARRWAGQVM